MKFLSICDPTRYKRPPLDVPTFYQKLSQDPRVAFYHLPTPWVSTHAPPQVQAVPLFGSLSYDEFVTAGHRLSDAIHLSNIDLVFCRTLKPFPTGYLNQLAEWEKYTRFVNSPTGKQKQIKSDFLLTIAQPYLPDAIATANASEALAFFEAHQVIVAKRENSCGGRGVFKIWYQEGAFQIDNILTGTGCFAKFSDVMRYLQGGTTQSLQFCRYLTRTQAGDKRVVVVDGEIYGSYLRRSKSGHWVNNVSSDGECVLADITDDERDAIDHTVRHYRALGLHTLGYDFLQDDDGTWRLSEINAGNIGGFARLEQLTGQPVMGRFIDWLRHYAQREKHAQPERSQVLEPRVREVVTCA